MSISFVIPTLNEEANVTRVFKLINETVGKTPIEWEVLFVDDKSTDNTQSEIKELPSDIVKLIISPERRGLGSALSLGWKEAKYEFVLFLDCDTGISVSDLKLLISSRCPKSVVIGSRYLKESVIHGAPKLKVFLSKILNRIAGFITQIDAADLSHSLRIFPNHFTDSLEISTHPGYFWVQGTHFKKNGYDFLEVPITFNERNIGLTKNETRKMVSSVIETLPIIIRKRFNEYR